MSLLGKIAKGADDVAAANLAPRPGKAPRVVVFFVWLFLFVFALPFLALTLVQARYGLIDGPPSVPTDPFGQWVKSIAFYGIFVWAGLQFLMFGRVGSWAVQVPAVSGVAPVAAQTLMHSLLSINEQDVPYTFNLNEMKQPMIEIIRYAGWTFRPVITFFRPIGG